MPISEELRNYIEGNLLWLFQEFESPQENQIRIITPRKSDFPFEWENDEKTAQNACGFVSDIMQIDTSSVQLEFYKNPVNRVGQGDQTIFLESDESDPQASGLYFGKNEAGKFVIAIDKSNLNNPELILSTLSHELAHIKLLGENRIEENDEMLTDLTSLYFGFGIFGANTSFSFYNTNESWGYRKNGYLTDIEWAYALAFYGFLVYETNPAWTKFLSPSMQKNFVRCERYIAKNKEHIMNRYNMS
ncbi:MAG: hypothetical protein CL840_19810 [Crocinitomicaceae bacterium]|nr:hypothetical protein [Crocinitomicaceae bacterium]